MASMLSKLWDDLAGGSPPEKGLEQLRKQNPEKSALFPSDDDTGEKSELGRRLSSGEYQSTTPPYQRIPMKKPLPMLDIPESHCATPFSLGSTPPTSPSPSTYPEEKDNLWRSVFHSGWSKVKRNLSTGADKVQESTSPTAYDWVVITALEG